MYSVLKRILPLAWRQKALKLIRNQMQAHWAQMDKAVNFVQLDQKHIDSTKLLLNRTELLQHLPKGGVVCEMGVANGDYSKEIMKICNPSKLHLVDIWASDRYNKSLQHHVEQYFAKEIESKQVEINLGLSTSVVSQFPDDYFDWIYIDTSHNYEVTKAELEMYASKVKPGGYIAGHDYIIGSWNYGIRYGVIEAVYEFCKNQNWKLEYITMENLPQVPSFAIKRI